jgi:hypothetical protein
MRAARIAPFGHRERSPAGNRLAACNSGVARVSPGLPPLLTVMRSGKAARNQAGIGQRDEPAGGQRHSKAEVPPPAPPCQQPSALCAAAAPAVGLAAPSDSCGAECKSRRWFYFLAGPGLLISNKAGWAPYELGTLAAASPAGARLWQGALENCECVVSRELLARRQRRRTGHQPGDRGRDPRRGKT